MKKILAFLLFGFVSLALVFGQTAFADEEDGIIDLYPYDQINCLEAVAPCIGTQVGKANWTLEYAGHRYHFVRGSDRYMKESVDANSDGFIDATEFVGATTSWASFSSFIINDTDNEYILKTANARTDLTGGVVARLYSYFDEDGNLVMFEDHIFEYHIYNEGTEAAPEWRLATEAEAAAFDADPDDEPNVYFSQIRIMLDDSAQGYVLEPLGNLSWAKRVFDGGNLVAIDKTANPDPEDWSDIINGDGVIYNGDPDHVVVPAGWTIVGWNSLDRDNSNPKTTAFVKSQVEYMLDPEMEPMVMNYAQQPAAFDGITALDDDGGTPGTQIVVEYNGTLKPTIHNVTASWMHMFDDQGKIHHKTEKLSFFLDIIDGEDVLQTIEYVYDEVQDDYTPDAAITSIDASVFGKGYVAKWYTTTPAGVDREVVADIVIGVMPPKFVGVADRYSDQGIPVDVLKGITAHDGYENDKTNDIVVSYPSEFNPYNPMPGVYQIDLTFTHNVFIPGDEFSLTVNGEVIPFDPEAQFNINAPTNATIKPTVYTDQDMARGIGSAWGSVLVLVAADGTMKESYDRFDWNHTTSGGTVVGDADLFAAWQAALVLEPGEFLLTAHGAAEAGRLRKANLAFGDPVVFVEGTDDFSQDIITDASYTITIDDTTAPILMVVNPNYQIYAGDFTKANDAILANVVAYDFTDAQDDLVIYVVNNGNLNVNNPGNYTVTVEVEDLKGNTDSATFTVTVLPKKMTQAEVDSAVQDAIDDLQDVIDGLQDTIDGMIDEADVQGLIDAATEGMIPRTQVETLINDAIEALPADEVGTSLIVTIVISVVTAGLAFGGAFILFGKK
ncbi:MAG: hypothetical protein WC225_01350 [Acholeplasmataceae bacterium]